MENNTKDSVSYLAFESTVARFERQNRRLVVILIITILLLFASNALWLYEWNQYDYSDTTTSTSTDNIDIDAKDGIANYIGNNGDIDNGTNKSDENKSNQ